MRLFVFTKQTAKSIICVALVLMCIICSCILRKTVLRLWGASTFSNSWSDSLYQFVSVIYYFSIKTEANLFFICFSKKSFASHSCILLHFIWHRIILVTRSEEAACKDLLKERKKHALKGTGTSEENERPMNSWLVFLPPFWSTFPEILQTHFVRI